MSEFKTDQAFSKFNLVWDLENECWCFQHKLSEKTYYVDDLSNPLPGLDKSKYLYEQYKRHALESSKNEMSPEFVVHWLEQIVLLNALYEAEDAHNKYITEHMNNGGKPAKVYKNADAEYVKVFNKHYERYHVWM